MRGLALALPLALAACTTAPPRVAAPAPVPTLAPPPPALAPTADERASKDTPGTWTYTAEAEATVARFGEAGATPLITISCRTAGRQIALVRAGSSPGPVTITTSYGTETRAAGATPVGTTVLIGVSDPLLDRIAFSRGRFTIGTPGQPDVVLPAWAEPARVVEDCRG